MDSRQVYRGMDVGTAKPTPAQRQAVRHFGLDLIDPDERFSAGRFARYARALIPEIEERGSIALLVGGTGFFLRALTHPIFQEPSFDAARRARLHEHLAAQPSETLLRWLAVLDPSQAEKLRNWGGRQRLLRALELPLLTGRPLSWWHEHSEPEAPPLQLDTFVLTLPKEVLDQRIESRVDEMLDAGLLAEVAGLLDKGYNEHSPGMNATGYIELIPVVRGEITLEAGRGSVIRNTRAYARRQMTWFRNQLAEGAVWLDASLPPTDLVDSILTKR